MDYFDTLPNEKLEDICYQMDLNTLSQFVQTSKRINHICSSVILNKIIQSVGYSKTELIRELNNATSFIRVRDLINEIYSSDPGDLLFPSIIQDLNDNFLPILFAEAFKRNKYNTIRVLLDSGRLDPNNPHIFELGLTFPFNDKYIIGYNIIELLHDDSRVTQESQRKYERSFLSNILHLYGSLYGVQLKELDMYKYPFNPEDIRLISNVITLDKPLSEAFGPYIHYWKDIYLKDIKYPIPMDLFMFIHLKPTDIELKDFISRMDPTIRSYLIDDILNLSSEKDITPEQVEIMRKYFTR